MTTTAFPPESATTPIATFGDILSALDRNPELREAMRQHILDEEIRQLPSAVRELRELVAELQQTLREFMAATNARFDRLEAAQAETQADVGELKAGQADHTARLDRLETGQSELRADVADLQAGQAEIIANQKSMQATITRLDGTVNRLDGTVNRLDGTVNRLDGKSYEHHAAHRAPRLAMRYFRVPDPQVVHAAAMPHSNRLYGPLNDAAAAGRITQDDAYDIENADVVLRDGNGGYCLAEVSKTLDDSDIVRARRRADLLAQAMDAPVLPFVIGAQILDTSRATAAAHQVTVCIMADGE